MKDSDWILLTTSKGTVMSCTALRLHLTTIFDPRYLSRPGAARPWPGDPIQVVLNHDNRLAAVVHGHKGLVIYQSIPETKHWLELDHPHNLDTESICAVQWHAGKDQIFAVDGSGALLVLSLSQDVLDIVFNIPGDAIGLAMDEYCMLLTTSHHDGIVRIFKTATMEVVYQVQAREPVTGAYLSPWARRLFVHRSTR